MSFSDADPLPGGELAAFVAAVESGTVQGAADALALTQSAATKRIQRLEARTGGPLLLREPRGVAPTALGQRLYPLAKQALAALAEAGAVVAADGGVQDLRLSASQTIGEDLLPGWLSRFRARAPEIHPQLDVVKSPTVVAAIRERSAEIGFVEGRDPLEGLQALTVARDRLVVVVDAGHRWGRRAAVAPRELAGEPYFAREAGSGTREVAENALMTAGIGLEPAMSLASVQSLKRGIAGGGFTILSELSVEAEVRAGTLVVVPLRELEIRRELRAIRDNGAHRAPAWAFWRWLEELAASVEQAAASRH